MAINDKRQPQQPSVNSMEDIGKIAGGNTNTSNNQQQPTSTKRSGGFTFASQEGLFGSTFTVVNDGLMKMVEQMKTIIKENTQSNRLELGFYPLDRNNHDLGMDILLVTTRDTELKGPHGVYALVICTSDTTLTTETTQAGPGHRSYTINTYPSQIFEADNIVQFLLQAARDCLGSNDVVFAGGCPIFTDFVNFEDKKEIQPALLNAINACTLKAFAAFNEAQGKLEDINLLEYDNKKETLEVDRKLVSGVVKDFHGNPIRADWQHVVNARQVQQNNVGFVGGSVAKEVFSISGYTDVVMVNPANTTHVDSPWARKKLAQSTDEQIFLPVNVFTSLMPTRQQSLGNIIYALGVGIGATFADYWYIYQALNPLNRAPDWQHTIAGLGYEASEMFRLPEFAPFPTPATDPNVSENDYLDIIGRYFLDSTSFAIDVGLGTPTEWMLSDFVNAAFEEDHVAIQPYSENAKILAVTDHLFGGRFKEVYSSLGGTGRVVFTLPNRRFLVGQYHNAQTGDTRSLQDVDRLFLDNNVNGIKENLEFTRALVGAQSDPRLEVQQGIGIQQEIVGTLLPHSRIVGYGARLEIENIYARAVHQCMLEVGPRLINRNVTNTFGQNMFANYIGSAMIDSLGRSILSNQTANNGPRSSLFGARWGNGVNNSGNTY